VAAKLDQERGRIAAAEAEKAKRLLATDLEDRTRQIAELNDVLRQRDAKLAEAQQAQADLIRKKRDSTMPSARSTLPSRNRCKPN
jgi:hypothetical protein